MRSTIGCRAIAGLLSLALVAAACGSDGDQPGGDDASPDVDREIDYEVLGLWDDGPCDETRDPLVIGLMTVFESPVLSLGDQALALDASADAFNERGGANGACIEVHTCDDGANLDQAVACVQEIDEAGVVATVNDQGTAGQAEVSAEMLEVGIPRVAPNVTNNDWRDQNAYPLDASGTGFVFMSPHSLIESGVDDLGLIRVDLPEASALTPFLEGLYEDDGATFVFDAAVQSGSTDYSQYILGAQDAGAGGVTIALGEQEATQLVRAGEQLDTDLLIGTGPGSFPHAAIAELGDFAEQLLLVNAYPPATFDLPVYEALRADLAASGEDALQARNLKSSPMRSWIGLYALVRMVRDAALTEFTRDGISTMLQQATDVPMLGIFGDEAWTPDLDHPGAFQRAGVNHWAIYRWDPEAAAPDGLEGNLVEVSLFSFDEVLCGSPIGGPPPC